MRSQPVSAPAFGRSTIRRHSTRALLPIVSATALLLMFSAHPLRAQASVSGTVRDEYSREPVASAEVRIDALGRVTRTDSIGRFRLTGLPAGQRVLSVRLIGYHAAAAIVDLVADETVVRDLTLTRAPGVLDTVAVVEDAMVIPAFEEHRRIGLGRFLTRAELAKVEQRGLGDVLASFQGVHVVRGLGGRAWIASRRGRSAAECSEREGASSLDSRVVRRTNTMEFQALDCACFVQVYLDEMPLYRGGDGGIVPDINRFSPAEIEAIEYYAGPAQTPLKYSKLNSQCGVLVIHTRRTP